MTQSDRILSALERGAAISPLTALERYGCMRLAARIDELRRAGHNIKTTMVHEKTGKRYALYYIPIEPEQRALWGDR